MTKFDAKNISPRMSGGKPVRMSVLEKRAHAAQAEKDAIESGILNQKLQFKREASRRDKEILPELDAWPKVQVFMSMWPMLSPNATAQHKRVAEIYTFATKTAATKIEAMTSSVDIGSIDPTNDEPFGEDGPKW